MSWNILKFFNTKQQQKKEDHVLSVSVCVCVCLHGFQEKGIELGQPLIAERVPVSS